MKNILKADYNRNALIISICSIFRKRSILSIGLKRVIVSQEKAKPIGLKGASGRALDP